MSEANSMDCRVVRADPARAVSRALMPNYWLQTLDTRAAYTRRHDDTDGKRDHEQDLTVMIGPDGDCWVEAGGGQMLRFRAWSGGGKSLRTRQALMILAEAIRLDNSDHPQSPNTNGNRPAPEGEPR